MSKIDYILKICAEISAQGKKPSVALIRNSAQQPVSIPEAIKALQLHKANPKAPAVSNDSLTANKQNIEKSLTQRVTNLEKQVDQMQQLIIKISQQNVAK